MIQVIQDREPDIVLHPKFAYWLIQSLLPMILVAAILTAGILWKPPYALINIVLLCLCLIILGTTFYNLVKWVLCTRWVISEEQITIEEGVFTKSTNYMEMYRVRDYEERQTILQRIFRNTTLYIYSSDMSHPVMKLFGIAKDPAMMGKIRQRVECQRKAKGIKEFSNL